MEIIKLAINQFGRYRSKDNVISNEKIGTMYLFLTTDIGCPAEPYDDWILNDDLGMYVSGNITHLEKDGDYVYIRNLYLYEKEEESVKVKISRQDLIQLLHDWNDKVCTQKPQEVTIMYENDTFTIETK